jgi:hypothetical protein
MNRVEHEVGAKEPKLVSVVDLGHFVCPTFGHCRQSIDGVPMRPDGIHYRGRSALAIAAWLLPQLRLVPPQSHFGATTIGNAVSPHG